MLYFSYGSNMSSKRLRSRVPSAKFVSVARLGEHRLAFHKAGTDGSAKCDAVYTGLSDDFLLGVVFDILPIEKPALDQAEGLGVGYSIKHVNLTSLAGDLLQAFTYTAMQVEAGLFPFHWYKEHVLQGALEFQLPAAYVYAIQNVVSFEDANETRRQQEMSLYK